MASESGSAEHIYLNDSLYNQVKKDNSVQTLNDLNQLLQDGESQYSYNPNGNRILKISDSETVRYAYDAQDRLISSAIAIEINGEAYAPMHDHLGHVMGLIKASNGSVFESDALQASPTLNNQLHSKIEGAMLACNIAQQCAKLPVSVPNLCMKLNL